MPFFPLRSERTPARILWPATISCAIAAGACSLLVSTSGLEGGAGPNGPEPSDAAPNQSDAASSQGDASTPADAGADPDLLGAWTFDDPAELARDVSGHGHDGQVVGGATYTPGGVRGGALLLSADGHVTVDSLGGAAFPRSGTLSLHFNFDFDPTVQTERNVFDTWANKRPHIFVRRPYGSTRAEFQVAGQYTDPDYVFVRNFTVERRTWTHVVVTWNEQLARGRVYRDGALLAEREYSEPFAPNDQRFKLGGAFIGMIDEVRLYARELTPDEVAALP